MRAYSFKILQRIVLAVLFFFLTGCGLEILFKSEKERNKITTKEMQIQIGIDTLQFYERSCEAYKNGRFSRNNPCEDFENFKNWTEKECEKYKSGQRAEDTECKKLEGYYKLKDLQK